LNCEGSDQLHYQLVRDNVISEIRQPLKVDKSVDRPEFDLLKGVESDLPLGVTSCSENEKIVPREHQVIQSSRFVRNMKDFSIETRPESKFYKLVYDKRVVDRETYKTYPYGYGQ